MKNKLYQPKVIGRALNFWPPFLFSGIRIETLSQDSRYCRVRLKLRWWNANANGGLFGGSLFAMTDPIYCLMLMGCLGKRYLICDQKADINFIKPGKGRVYAEFHLTDKVVSDVQNQTQFGEKTFVDFVVKVKDERGELVCDLNRTVYVRLHKKYREQLDKAA